MIKKKKKIKGLEETWTSEGGLVMPNKEIRSGGTWSSLSNRENALRGYAPPLSVKLNNAGVRFKAESPDEEFIDKKKKKLTSRTKVRASRI